MSLTVSGQAPHSQAIVKKGHPLPLQDAINKALPFDVLKVIFFWLTDKELGVASSVCRTWKVCIFQMRMPLMPAPLKVENPNKEEIFQNPLHKEKQPFFNAYDLVPQVKHCLQSKQWEKAKDLSRDCINAASLIAQIEEEEGKELSLQYPLCMNLEGYIELHQILGTKDFSGLLRLFSERGLDPDEHEFPKDQGRIFLNKIFISNEEAPISLFTAWINALPLDPKKIRVDNKQIQWILSALDGTKNEEYLLRLIRIVAKKDFTLFDPLSPLVRRIVATSKDFLLGFQIGCICNWRKDLYFNDLFSRFKEAEAPCHQIQSWALESKEHFGRIQIGIWALVEELLRQVMIDKINPLIDLMLEIHKKQQEQFLKNQVSTSLQLELWIEVIRTLSQHSWTLGELSLIIEKLPQDWEQILAQEVSLANEPRKKGNLFVPKAFEDLKKEVLNYLAKKEWNEARRLVGNNLPVLPLANELYETIDLEEALAQSVEESLEQSEANLEQERIQAYYKESLRKKVDAQKSGNENDDLDIMEGWAIMDSPSDADDETEKDEEGK